MRKSNFLENKITAMVEETEARQHVLFSGLNSRLTKKAKHSLRVCRRCTLFIRPMQSSPQTWTHTQVNCSMPKKQENHLSRV